MTATATSAKRGTTSEPGAAAVRDECARGVRGRRRPIRVGQTCRRRRWEGSVTVGSVHRFLADPTAEIYPPTIVGSGWAWLAL